MVFRVLVFGVWVERVEQAVAPKVLVDATYRALQHLTDFARLQMSERLPRKLCPLLVVGAVEKHHVQVRVQLQVRRRALHNRDSAGLGVSA